MKESPRFRPEEIKSPETENTISFETVRRAIQEGAKELFKDVSKFTSENAYELLANLQERARELGIRPGDVHLVIETVSGLKKEVTASVSETGQAPKKQVKRTSPTIPGKYSIALAAVLLTGCHLNEDAIRETEAKEQRAKERNAEILEAKTADAARRNEKKEFKKKYGVVKSHGKGQLTDKYFDPNKEYTPPAEVAGIHPPDCGVKPDHAPTECGEQQWKGYSEINPVAVAWLAIANVGEEACTAEVTRMELSYTDSAGERQLLTSSIHDAYALADGSGKRQFGTWSYAVIEQEGKTAPGSAYKFDIPPNIPAYVHPFGPKAFVPYDATELTITFSAEITEGCVIEGGIDTYTEWDFPSDLGAEGGEYTQDGSETDFIKEALKTPWVKTSVSPDEPISFSIERVPDDDPRFEALYKKRIKTFGPEIDQY